MTLVIDPDRWVRERIHSAQRRLQRSPKQPPVRAAMVRPISTAADWTGLKSTLLEGLLSTEPIDRGSWQALDVSGSSLHRTHELNGVRFSTQLPSTMAQLQQMLEPDLPWAEDHFTERVCGRPLNPSPSEAWWPYTVGANELHKSDGVFDHTYPERYWPKFAAGGQFPHSWLDMPTQPRQGLRFEYGDLEDVVETLYQNPMTRQAVLTVWFPEDQWAAAHGKRVPCSLTYHFLAPELGKLDLYYTIRSCDFYRHMTNDLYMTARLLQWVVERLNRLRVTPSMTEASEPRWMADRVVRLKASDQPPWRANQLTMSIDNLHLFAGDVEKV